MMTKINIADSYVKCLTCPDSCTIHQSDQCRNGNQSTLGMALFQSHIVTGNKYPAHLVFRKCVWNAVRCMFAGQSGYVALHSNQGKVL